MFLVSGGWWSRFVPLGVTWLLLRTRLPVLYSHSVLRTSHALASARTRLTSRGGGEVSYRLPYCTVLLTTVQYSAIVLYSGIIYRNYKYYKYYTHIISLAAGSRKGLWNGASTFLLPRK
jgi:hypothetical protein